MCDALPGVDVLQSGQDLPGEGHVVGSEIRGLVVDVLDHPLEGRELVAAEDLERGG